MHDRVCLQCKVGVQLWQERAVAADMLISRYVGLSDLAATAFTTTSYTDAQAWFAREVRRSRAEWRGASRSTLWRERAAAGRGPEAWFQ